MENVNLGNTNGGKSEKSCIKTPDFDVIAKEAGLSYAEKAKKIHTFLDRSIGLAYRILGDHELALEAVGTATVKALTDLSLNKFNHQSKLETWFYRIVTNTALDSLRRENTSKLKIVDNETFDNMDEKFEVADTLPNPEELAIREQKRRLVKSALATLPKGQREAIIMTKLYGDTGMEVAKQKNIPEATVRTNVNRGMKKLRKKLNSQFRDIAN
jgi:RNA polymerase sigma-70 factor (ECF subfamily)